MIDAEVKWGTRKSMYAEVVRPGGIGAELGVLRGDNAVDLLGQAKPRRLFLVDVWRARYLPGWKVDRKAQARLDRRCDYVRGRFAKDASRVRVLRMTTEEAAYGFEPKSLNWVYIDANHRYAAVLMDMQIYLPRIKVGGLMMMHDFNKRVFDGGVIKAVDHMMSTVDNLEILGKTSAPSERETIVLRKVGE